MSTRAVNTALFALVIAQWASGLLSFFVGTPSGRWVAWAHAAGGGAILVLLAWKGGVILRSLRRQGLGRWAVPSLGLLALLLGALVSGVLWSMVGLPWFLGSTGLTWHVVISLAMLPLFWPHARRYRPHPRPRDYLGRRRLLQRGALLAGGVVAWQGLEASARAVSLPGADRRFTGSYDAGGTGNDFPRTSWLTDDPSPVAVPAWRLRVGGHVRAPFVLDLGALDRDGVVEAVLDCTGGWYARRSWQGLSLAALLDRAEPRPGARSIVVTGVTGYSRRFPLDTARAALLATAVEDEPLTHGHGAPARLVVPGARGYDWVKWVTRIEVSRLPPWLDWPLPVR